MRGEPCHLPTPRGSAITPASSGPWLTCCAATTSSQSTAGSSCRWWSCAAWTACWSRPRQGFCRWRIGSPAESGTSSRYCGRRPGGEFYNTSPLHLRRLLDDPSRIADNLLAYLDAFSPAARDGLEEFDLRTQIDRLDRANLLYLVVSKFCEIDLHPEVVSNLEMGYLDEELIRRFSELSNETAGEHFTPREVIRLPCAREVRVLQWKLVRR
jgi:hypothetical protein